VAALSKPALTSFSINNQTFHMASSFGLMNESDESNLLQVTNTDTLQNKKVEDRILE
jgi:hypothetical protein